MPTRKVPAQHVTQAVRHVMEVTARTVPHVTLELGSVRRASVAVCARMDTTYLQMVYVKPVNWVVQSAMQPGLEGPQYAVTV